MSGVLCSGNLSLDVIVRPVERIQWGATTIVETIERRLGGNAANTAYALAKLGARARVLGAVGNDDAADFVLGKMRAAGVDLSAVKRLEAPTATTIALVRGSGERLFLHRRGVNAVVDFDAAELAHQFAGGFGHYHMSTPFALLQMRTHMAAMLKQARETGLRTSLDTHWDSLGRWMEDLAPCLPFTDILFVNEDEARMLTGSAGPDSAGAALLAAGAGSVVIKLGARGCAVYGAAGEFRSPGFAVQAVDTTGAGDCFVGGFLAALDRGAPWREAARLANALGALSVERLGAVEGVLTYEETLEWLRRRTQAGYPDTL
ncbi:MAG: carbohydrate kinase family protein [Bryobacteraceae bacterium]